MSRSTSTTLSMSWYHFCPTKKSFLSPHVFVFALAALPLPSAVQGFVADNLDDPAWFVHDEAQCDDRDDPRHLARVWVDQSFRPRRPGSGLRRTVQGIVNIYQSTQKKVT